jgi:sigma-B regulation protein RsbU (phosphoserine phosphatase)
MVPGEIFRKNDAVVHARMRPAKSVGGDYYDVLELDERRVAVILGDVAGKGLPAAMLMASVLGSMRALCSAGLRGSELISALNKLVRANTSGDRLVTLFYGELDTSTGQIAYVNAGHNPPILLRSDGRVDRLQPTARVLGLLADALVESRDVEIKPADRLLLFTDGLTEAVNKKNQEYGEERVKESLSRGRALSSSIVVEHLIADALSFCGSVQPFDDITLMLVERERA